MEIDQMNMVKKRSLYNVLQRENGNLKPVIG